MSNLNTEEFDIQIKAVFRFQLPKSDLSLCILNLSLIHRFHLFGQIEMYIGRVPYFSHFTKNPF